MGKFSRSKFDENLGLMKMKKRSEKKNNREGKKGLSSVVAVLLIVLLTVVSVVVLYASVKTLINQKIDDTSNCGPDILEKVSLNKKYTCYYNRTEIEVTETVCNLGNVEAICTQRYEHKKCYIEPGASTGYCINKVRNELGCNPGYIYNEDEYCEKYTGYQYIGLNIGDIDLEKVIVTLSDGKNVKDYEIKSGPISTTNPIYMYGLGPADFDGKEDTSLILSKKTGKTYVIKYSDLPTLNMKPQSVRVSAVVNGKRCSNSDQVLEIPSCDPDFGFPVLTSPGS